MVSTKYRYNKFQKEKFLINGTEKELIETDTWLSHNVTMQLEVYILDLKKFDFLNLLSSLKHNELEFLKHSLSDAIESAKKRKSLKWLKLLEKKLAMVKEAIMIKQGNEEEAWDFLS